MLPSRASLAGRHDGRERWSYFVTSPKRGDSARIGLDHVVAVVEPRIVDRCVVDGHDIVVHAPLQERYDNRQHANISNN